MQQLVHRRTNCGAKNGGFTSHNAYTLIVRHTIGMKLVTVVKRLLAHIMCTKKMVVTTIHFARNVGVVEGHCLLQSAAGGHICHTLRE